jgi:DNA processing protein
MDKKLILLTLKNIEKIGNVTAKKIMDSVLVDDINLEKLYTILQNFPRVKIADFDILKKAHFEAEKMLDRLSATNIDIVTYLDQDYPASFLTINDPPVFIFYSGDISITSQRCVAVVGARNLSEKGKKIAYGLSAKLCKNNIIVSGLAEGVDTEAHRATIENNGKTIAILGHGLDIIFPVQNKQLSEDIVKTGGLIISEYPLGQTYSKYTFVARNRLQSALSESVFIVEASENSGTMHTAKKALKYNKELFVFKSKSQDYLLPSGNLKLIHEGAKVFDEDYLT